MKTSSNDGRCLMSHDLVGLGFGSRLLIDIHGIVTTLDNLALNLLFELIFTLVLKVDTSFFRHLVFLSRLSILLNACHLGIAISSRSGSATLTSILGGSSLFLFSIIFEFLGAVFFVVSLKVGFRLLRRELGWSRCLRIPSSQISKDLLNKCSDWMSTYHLIAKRVTRGLSARTLRRIFSTIGLAGGSAFNSSDSYSLLT